MSTLVIRGGRVIDPASGRDETTDVWIRDQRIAAIGACPDECAPDLSIDARGCVVAPGLVDLCAHLREPGQTHKGTIASETAAAVAGGITSLCCSPDTQPPLDTPATVELVRGRACAAARARVHPVGALTQGLAGNYLAPMAALASAGCVAVGQARRAIRDSHVLRNALEYAATLGLTTILPPIDPTLVGGCAHAGPTATRLGLQGIPTAAETAEIERILTLAGDTGARIHISCISAAPSADLIRSARTRGLAVTADVGAHHLALTERAVEGFDSRAHLQPPLRDARDRNALREAVADGTLSAVCSDHQPHDSDAKLAPFARSEPGLSGLETLLPLMLARVAAGDMELPAALARVTAGPAAILGLDAGTLTIGGTADLVVFTPHQTWQVDPRQFTSRGRNTPFTGNTMAGRIRATVVAGGICFPSAGA